MNSPLRDRRIGKRLALTGGVRILVQADRGGSITHDNVMRMADWRNRAATIPLETRIAPMPYKPIPRWRSLVQIYYPREFA